MQKESPLASLDQFLTQYKHLATELHGEAMCARWGLPRETFAEGLRRSAEKRFGGAQIDPGDVEVYLKSLHLGDLHRPFPAGPAQCRERHAPRIGPGR